MLTIFLTYLKNYIDYKLRKNGILYKCIIVIKTNKIFSNYFSQNN